MAALLRASIPTRALGNAITANSGLTANGIFAVTVTNTADGSATALPPPSHSANTSLALGLALGLGLPIALLALVWFIMRRCGAAKVGDADDGKAGDDVVVGTVVQGVPPGYGGDSEAAGAGPFQQQRTAADGKSPRDADGAAPVPEGGADGLDRDANSMGAGKPAGNSEGKAASGAVAEGAMGADAALAGSEWVPPLPAAYAAFGPVFIRSQPGLELCPRA